MVRIKITCREIKIEDENFGRIPTPKNLESMLVNFTLMVLLTINQVGYFYRTRYCVTRLLTVIKFFQSLEQFFLTVGQIIFWKQNTISFSTNQTEKNLWNKFGKQIGEIICWIRNNNLYLFFQSLKWKAFRISCLADCVYYPSGFSHDWPGCYCIENWAEVWKSTKKRPLGELKIA